MLDPFYHQISDMANMHITFLQARKCGKKMEYRSYSLLAIQETPSAPQLFDIA